MSTRVLTNPSNEWNVHEFGKHHCSDITWQGWLILGLHPANKRRCYFVATSLIGIFNSIFLNENVWTLIKISLKFVPKGVINNIPALVQIMAWRRPGHKPLSEPVVVNLLTHICITRLQWVNKILTLKQFLHYWSLMQGIVTCSCIALMYSLLLAWISYWTNIQVPCDYRLQWSQTFCSDSQLQVRSFRVIFVRLIFKVVQVLNQSHLI